MVNLSNRVLTDDENNILEKGLKFCPTTKFVNEGDQKLELDRFHNGLRTSQFFSKEEKSQTKVNKDKSGKTTLSENENKNGENTNVQKEDESVSRDHPSSQVFNNPKLLKKLKGKSNWKAPPGSLNLESFITINELELSKNLNKRTPKQNITDGEKLAIKQLAKDKNIIIKQADKGGSIVIQNTTDYIHEAQRQLSDTNTYQKLTKDPTVEHNELINQRIDQLTQNLEIIMKMTKALKNEKPRTPLMYFLPKIHKYQTPPPGRPICSATSGPTEKISALVDHFLNPLVKETDSYIEDTRDFLCKIKQNESVKPDSIIGTLDVGSLYTNIPNDEGMESIKEVLESKRKRTGGPTNQTLLDLLEIILKKNNFQFNGTNYLQISGTAMGTKVAPSYANLFMSKLEKEMLETYPLKPTTWWRYIDDIFFIWDYGEIELEKWLHHLNTYHRTIKFTSEWSKQKVHFLDTTVRKTCTNKLETDLYQKPTDRNNYLHYTSAHPVKSKDSIPYSQFLTIKRICTNDEDSERHIKRNTTNFMERGYPEKILEKASNKAKEHDRNSLLQKRKRNKNASENDKVYLVNTYLQNHRGLPEVVRKNWEMLGRSISTKGVYNKRLISCYKRPKNLKDHLVRARIDYHPTPLDDTSRREGTEPEPKPESRPHNNRCEKKNCKHCPKIMMSNGITSKTTGKTHQTKYNVTCESSNLIYCIKCKTCKSQYVGQTKRKIKFRMGEHLRSIRNKTWKNDVPTHFNKCDHNGVDDVQLHILDFIYAHPESKRAAQLRNKIEQNWIHRLRTVSPQGMNTMDNKFG